MSDQISKLTGMLAAVMAMQNRGPKPQPPLQEEPEDAAQADREAAAMTPPPDAAPAPAPAPPPAAVDPYSDGAAVREFMDCTGPPGAVKRPQRFPQ
jgi:hypothetical protein